MMQTYKVGLRMSSHLNTVNVKWYI